MFARPDAHISARCCVPAPTHRFVLGVALVRHRRPGGWCGSYDGVGNGLGHPAGTPCPTIGALGVPPILTYDAHADGCARAQRAAKIFELDIKWVVRTPVFGVGHKSAAPGVWFGTDKNYLNRGLVTVGRSKLFSKTRPPRFLFGTRSSLPLSEQDEAVLAAGHASSRHGRPLLLNQQPSARQPEAPLAHRARPAFERCHFEV